MLANDTTPAELRLRGASAAQRAVMVALALGAAHRPRTWIFTMLGHLGEREG